MIVPFLKKRIDKEFSSYLDEHSASVAKAIKAAKAKSVDSRLLYAKLFPLFVLLRCLASPEYIRDPSRDAALSELQRNGDKGNFVKALAYFNRPRPFQREMITGLQNQVFTGYFDELFSDCLLLLNSYYTYSYRSAMIAIRCMLEDLYRHLYYRDHPQEFRALLSSRNTEYQMGLSPSEFRDYLKRTDYLQIFFKLNTDFLPKNDGDMDIFGINEELYSNCSGFVHGSSSASLNAFRSNSDFAENFNRQEEVISVATRFCKVAVAFLISAHLDHFLAANDYERSMILTSFNDVERTALRRSLNI